MALDDGIMTWNTPGETARDVLIPRFFIEAVPNKFRSEQEGKPCFDEAEFVEILMPSPGGRGGEVVRRVKPEDKERWASQYAKFKAGLEQPLDGTPIDAWPPVGVAQAKELKSSNVRTVEMLAGLDDLTLSKVVNMGGHALRQKARDWLEQAKSNAPLMRLEAEGLEKDAKIADLQRQLNELAARINAKPAPQPEEPFGGE